ncbi:MAG: hypothetical protein ACOC0V_03475 [Oceanicaulis sp.]
MTGFAEAVTWSAMTDPNRPKQRVVEPEPDREERLAAALRANLRRRKTAKKPDKDAGQP